LEHKKSTELLQKFLIAAKKVENFFQIASIEPQAKDASD
jgi:hypothetical protein